MSNPLIYTNVYIATCHGVPPSIRINGIFYRHMQGSARFSWTGSARFSWTGLLIEMCLFYFF